MEKMAAIFAPSPKPRQYTDGHCGEILHGFHFSQNLQSYVDLHAGVLQIPALRRADKVAGDGMPFKAFLPGALLEEATGSSPPGIMISTMLPEVFMVVGDIECIRALSVVFILHNTREKGQDAC